MTRNGDVMGAGGIAEQALYLSMFLGPVLLYPLFTLPSRLPFFATLIVANLLPLFLLPLGLKRNDDSGSFEPRQNSFSTEEVTHG